MKLILALLLLCNVAFAQRDITFDTNKASVKKETKNITLTESNSINFNRQFTRAFVAKKQVEAMTKCFANVGADIYITLYTPGGSISAGQLFSDTLQALPCKFHTITVFAASMGYQTVQNLGKRYILSSGILMSHRAWVQGIGGEIGGELDSILKLLKSNVKSLNKIAANRVGLSLEEYERQIADELWLTSDLAVKSNHADEIVNAICDSSLMGTNVQSYNTFFGTVDVEFSNCPIIVGPLRVVIGTQKAFNQVQDMYTNTRKHIKLEL